MVGVREDLVGFHELGLVVALVDGFAVGAWCGGELAAVDGEGLEDEGPVAWEGVGSVLPLHDGRGALWDGGV